MSDDLVKRLRDWENVYLEDADGPAGCLYIKAADRIEAPEAKLKKAVAALELYSCDDGCNECPESERDRVSCGWTARASLATLAELTGGKDDTDR